MKHNFLPCVFTMAGTVMAFHYQTFIEKLRSRPITLAYGQSGTGKTTALHCGLGLMGVDNLRFFRDLSSAKVSQLCLVISNPLGVDDPDSKNSFSKIIMDLFNGAKLGTLSYQPLTSDLWRALYSKSTHDMSRSVWKWQKNSQFCVITRVYTFFFRFYT